MLNKVKDITKLDSCIGYAQAGATWECTDTSIDIETTLDKGTVFGQINLLNADVDSESVNPNVITIALGTNGGVLGEFWEDEVNLILNTDTTTIAGAMHVSLQKILSKYTDADIRIGGIIPPQGDARVSELNETIKQRNAMIRRIYEFYAIPYLDLEKMGGILSRKYIDNGTLGDNVHPSELGNKIYLRKLSTWIQTL